MNELVILTFKGILLIENHVDTIITIQSQNQRVDLPFRCQTFAFHTQEFVTTSLVGCRINMIQVSFSTSLIHDIFSLVTHLNVEVRQEIREVGR